MEFAAELLQSGKSATGIEVPTTVIDALAGGKRPAVTVTLNGFAFRTTIGSMDGKAMIPVSADRRTAAGVAAGDRVKVTIELDTAPRTVEVPADLARALKAAGATDAFARLAPSHKKAHVDAVEGAKTEATRERRIAKAVENVLGA